MPTVSGQTIDLDAAADAATKAQCVAAELRAPKKEFDGEVAYVAGERSVPRLGGAGEHGP